MKNIKSFILGMATVVVVLPIAESITELICGALEPIKAENTKKILKLNKEIAEIQMQLEDYHDDTQAIGFQVDTCCDDEDEDWEDEDFVDKNEIKDKVVIGFR